MAVVTTIAMIKTTTAKVVETKQYSRYKRMSIRVVVIIVVVGNKKEISTEITTTTSISVMQRQQAIITFSLLHKNVQQQQQKKKNKKKESPNRQKTRNCILKRKLVTRPSNNCLCHSSKTL